MFILISFNLCTGNCTDGRVLFTAHADSTDQMRRILAAKYAFPEGVSPAFKDVVRRFLSVNAVHRLGSLKGGVKDVKLHPWFKVCLFLLSYGQMY